jgi:membrane fusion protein (multidrug efflux system)
MKRTAGIIYATAAVIAVGGIGLFATAPRETSAVAEVTAAREAAVEVPLLEVEERVQRDRVEVSGMVQAIRRVVLSAEIDGRVADLGARAHQRVRADQVLVQLDDAIRRAALARAEAAVVRARSAHRLAQLELERAAELFARRVTSESERDRAAAEERATFAALAEAEAMAVEAAELLAKTTIRAPFDGVVAELDIEVGDQLSPGARLGEVIDLAAVEVELGVSDAEAVALRPGDAVQLTVAVHAGRSFPGVIRAIASAMHSQTRKFPVEVIADNPDGALLPGMIARAAFELGAPAPAIRIPRQATIEEFGLTYVYALEAEGDQWIARRRRVEVRPVAFRPAEVEVTGGLRHGERIAAAGLRELRDGLAVGEEGAS